MFSFIIIFSRFLNHLVLCHRLLPWTECIALEHSEGKIRRNEEEKDKGMKAKKEEVEDWKREEDNAANSRCLLASLFSLVSVLSFSSWFHPWKSFQHSLSVPSLFFRTPRGVNTSYLIRMQEKQEKQESTNGVKPRVRRQFDCGCLVKITSSLLITIDTRQRAIDDKVFDRVVCDRAMRFLSALLDAILLGRRGTTLSANEKDVGDPGVV